MVGPNYANSDSVNRVQGRRNTKVLSLVEVKNLSKGLKERKEVEKGTHRLTIGDNLVFFLEIIKSLKK